MTSNNIDLKNIAIFASGGGSNAEAIIQYFENKDCGIVKLIVSNNDKAHVLARAQKHNINSLLISNDDLTNPSSIIDELNKQNIELIVLAGFLRQIPSALISAYPQKLINIHPALLPKFGGKGMYGKRVHQAVFDTMTLETGITIHYVNEAYDEGQIIFQKEIELDTLDTPDIIAKKVLELEHAHYPRVIEEIILGVR